MKARGVVFYVSAVGSVWKFANGQVHVQFGHSGRKMTMPAAECLRRLDMRTAGPNCNVIREALKKAMGVRP